MVSLQPNRMSTGAQYMDEVMPSDTNAASNSDVEPILASTDNTDFEKLRTIPVFGVHLFISMVISFADIILVLHFKDKDEQNLHSIMIILRGVFWVITSKFDNKVSKHHNGLRIKGYHDFYRTISRHNGEAFTIVSGLNTVLLLGECLNTKPLWNKNVMPYWYTLAFQLAETCTFIFTHGHYIYTVHKFNKNTPYPDALRGSNSSAGSLGLMQPGGNTAELYERQNDLVSYLVHHNYKLLRRLHQRTGRNTDM